MSVSDLKTKARLAMSELLDRILGGSSPNYPSTPSRSLDLSELEERILLSASPAMVVASEMVDGASADSMPAETATIGTQDDTTGVSSTQTTDQSSSQTGSNVTTDPSQTVRHEIVFLDTSVDDYQQLLDDLWSNTDSSREFEVVLLQNSRDGIEQITEALAGRTDLDAVHIVSHGTNAAVKLGSTWLTQDNLAGYVGEISRWGNSLSADADLLFYGCDLAASDDGRMLIDSFSTLTGADVAASDDDTGHAIFGADWELEYQVGQIEAGIAFSQDVQDNWGHVMNVTVDATSTGTIARGSSSSTISHTTSGTNRLLLVAVSFGEDKGQSASSVTYNGTSLTRIGAREHSDPSKSRVEIWSLVAPASGTNNVVVTLTGTDHSGATIGVMSFTNVDQVTPLGTFASAQGDSSTASTTVSSATGELVFGVVAVESSTNFNLAPDSGQSEHWDLFANDKGNGGGSVKAGAASVTNSWTWGSSNKWAVAGISIRQHIAGSESTSFQQGTNSYTGTEDTELDSGSADTSKGNNTSIVVDLDDGSGQAQGLIQFDSIFGNGANQIPLGSIIHSASLQLHVLDPAGAGDQITLHRMLVDWNESSTWNSLTGGISANNVEASSTAESTLADPTATGTVTFTGLASAMQAWSDGGNNYGWAILTNSSNGWDFVSSEGSTVNQRPRLVINYTVVNNAPTTSDKTVSTNEDTTYTFTAADFNYSDSDGDPFDHIQITQLESVGALKLSGADVTFGQIITAADITAGNLKFTPVSNANGTGYDSFDFRVSDGALYSEETATLSLLSATFNAGSEGFVYSDDVLGTALPAFANGTYEVSGGKTGGGLKIALAGAATGGATSGGWQKSFNLASDGIVTVSLDYRLVISSEYEANEFGEAVLLVDGVRYGNATNTSLRHAVGDGNGGVADDSGWLSESFDITLSAGSHTITLAAYNNVSTEAAEFVEAYFDNVSVNRNTYNTATIDVTAVNDPPSITTIANQTTAEDTATGAITFKIGDVETAAGSLTVTATSNDQTVIPNANITLGGSGTNRTINILPATNQNGGPATITVTVDDGTTTSQTTFDVAVTAVNDAPTITSDGGGATAAVNVAENSTAVTTVTSNDIDGGTASYSITGGADAAKFSIDGLSGALTFAVAPDFESPTDTGGDNVYDVVVQVSDGTLTDTQSIAVTVTAVNDNTPVITSDGGGATASVNVAENSTSVTTVTATDADLPGQTLSYSITGGADAAKFSIDGSSGALTFAVAPNRESLTDSDTNNVYEVTVQVSDGTLTDTQSIEVTINDLDEFDVTSPADSDGAANAVNENAANGTVVGLTAAASDADATTNGITYALFDDAGGRFAIDAATGIVTVADGSLLNREAATSHDITVRASSQDGSTADSSFTIAINDLNDNSPIVGLGQSFSVSEFATNGTSLGIAVASDVDTVGSIQNWMITSGNSDGIFEIDAATGEIRVFDNTLLNFETTASYLLGLTVEDGQNTSTDQTVLVSIVDENDVPVLAANLGVSVVEGANVMISSAELSVIDEDELPGQILFSVVSSPVAGRLEMVADPGTSINSFTQDDINTGRLRYVHDGSEADDSFTFTVSDGSGGMIATTTFSITNLRVNDAPVNTVPPLQMVNEDSPLVFSSTNGNSISVNDVDLNGELIGVRLVADKGTLTLASTAGLVFASGDGSNDTSMVFAGSISDVNAALDGLRFDPTANYNGPASVRIVARDMGSSGSGGEQSDDDTINITVEPVNDTPVAADDFFSTDEDSSLMISTGSGLVANDFDIDGDVLSVIAVSSTANGTLSLNTDGSFVYTPNTNFNGVDSFTYRASDGSLQSEIRTVTLTVNAVNDAPVSNDESFVMPQLTILKLTAADGVLINDVDVEADTLRAILVDSPRNGTLVLNADGSFTYTPAPTFFGEDSFTYRSNDGSLNGSIATVRIVVQQTVTSGTTNTSGGGVTTDDTSNSDGTAGANIRTVVLVISVEPGGNGFVVSSSDNLLSTPQANDSSSDSTMATDTATDNVDSSAGDSQDARAISEMSFAIDDRGELRDRMTGRIVEDAGVVVFTSTDVGSMVYVLEQSGFWSQLDNFQQDVQHSMIQEGEWETLVVETTTVAGTTLTVGYIVWLLRSGSVVFGLISSLPAWTMMDPLPILESGLANLTDGEAIDDDDSLQGILQAHRDGLEPIEESFEN